MARRSIDLVTFVVRDYDEAIEFFCRVLDFERIEDRSVPEQGKRWVVVAPGSSSGTRLLLARASSEQERARVGAQTGGRVAFFLTTDDLARDFEVLKDRGLHFEEEPRSEAYGSVAVFRDLYGNRWDLIEPAGES